MATMSDPNAIDPKLYVLERMNDSRTAVEQKEDASMGLKHQVPMTPAMVVRLEFFMGEIYINAMGINIQKPKKSSKYHVSACMKEKILLFC
mmetsp:Transcript_15397/g.20596  ORF Transcript_15397/g.20596 Transcript_15397/m.20596 type:complete len:91 (+) Transcript_15397:670-942(+)